jgi:hypothetical protein
MLIPGDEIKSPSVREWLRGNKGDEKRSRYLRNLTNPAAILSWKVLASRDITYQNTRGDTRQQAGTAGTEVGGVPLTSTALSSSGV